MTELTAEYIGELARDTLATWFPRYTEYDDTRQAQWRITHPQGDLPGEYLLRCDAGETTRTFAVTISVVELP